MSTGNLHLTPKVPLGILANPLNRCHFDLSMTGTSHGKHTEKAGRRFFFFFIRADRQPLFLIYVFVCMGVCVCV